MAVVRSIHKRSNSVVIDRQNARKIGLDKNVDDLGVTVRSGMVNRSVFIVSANQYDCYGHTLIR